MIKSITHTCFLLLLMIPYASLAQVDANEITDRFEDYHRQTAIEKVYIHTNRERLTLGETLYLSAYVLNGQDHTPTFLSGVLYVDLVSPEEEIKETLKLRIDSLGRSSGSITLSDSLDAGIYTLRAYTRYQMNFDPDYLFTKSVKLLPRLKVQEVTEGSPNKVPQIVLDFFPEGGDLIAGAFNFIAFKATDQYGNPLSIQGNILNGKGEKVAPFKSEHDGMGVFQLFIEKENYTCTFEFGGRSFSQPLPNVNPSGYLMHVTNTNDRWYTEVKPMGNVIEGSFLVLQCRGKILYVVGPQPGAETLRFSLGPEDLPNGIIQLTFFDSRGRAMTERLIYNENPSAQTSLAITTDESSYGKRSKVGLDLKIAEIDGNTPGIATMSTTVVPKSLRIKPDISIHSYLLLTSDLKGYVHNPTYYFNPENPERFRYLDLLMMTHGWRRFDWESAISGDMPELNYFFEQGIRIEGTVSNYVDRKRPVVADLVLSFPENPTFKLETTSLENGLFWFDRLKFTDTLAAYVKTLAEDSKKSKKKENSTFIRIHDRDIPSIQEYYRTPYQVTPIDKRLIDRGERLFDIASAFEQETVVLEDFVLESERESDNISNDFLMRQGMIYSEPDHRIMLDSFPQYYRDVFQYLYGVPGLVVTGFAPNARVRIRGAESFNSPTDPIYMLDGIERDVTFVNNLNVMNILFIDVLKGPTASLYGSRGSNGVIALYSRQAGDKRDVPEQDLPGVAFFKVAGYTPARQFYMPDYSNPTEEEMIRPDFRSTVYWDPIRIVKDGQTTFDFYTSDETGEFIIYSEGITLEGKIFSGTTSYEVE